MNTLNRNQLDWIEDLKRKQRSRRRKKIFAVVVATVGYLSLLAIVLSQMDL